MTSEPRITGSVRRHVPELALEWLLEAPERRWQILDGTLCFADISGFTAQAERLARRGRQGGEELISRLGGVFATMLDLARERGGMLLKFGGDALMLFFQGPDHALQAASAAVAMRQVLRQAAATPTSVGPLRLSMSVGLHSGPTHFFLVGEGHRELLLLGPATNGVVAIEGAAGAGEIALAASTLALLPRASSLPRADGLPLLRWRKPALPPCGPRPEPTVTEAQLRSLFPKVLCDYLGPRVPEPEHRVACIAFIRFSGTDALLQSAGPDAVAEALDHTLGAIQSCLDAESITLLAVDVDRDGGKLFLGSGVPYAHADDEGNMLRALRHIADLELPLALQLGVNRGHVFVAEVGSVRRAAYSAMGDTTNTAARIAAKAPLGAIYAHPSVLDESLAVFEVTPSPALLMKGKRAPLVVYRIGAHTGSRRREGLKVAEFVGRSGERSRLGAAIDAALAGRGGVLCLTGGTGMGKSKLLGEALSSSRQSPLLWLRGEPNTANSALALVRPGVVRLLGLEAIPVAARAAACRALIESTSPGWLPLLPLVAEIAGIAVPPTPEVAAIDPRFRLPRAADLLIELVERRYPGPRIWVVDDAHWCDESSAAILDHLGAACAGRPWLLIVARRPGAGGFVPAGHSDGTVESTAIDLAAMPAQELAVLLRIASEAAPLRPHELDALVGRAGGNPLFALELLRAAREAGSFDAVPESLEAVMAAQVDALDPEARRLLRLASVLGRRFSRDVLAQALHAEGQEVAEGVLERLQHFLEPDGAAGLRFSSDVIRETTYQAVSYQLRRRLHLRAGQSLEALAQQPEEIADELAEHFARGDDHARAWRYARIAANRARERFANAEAARFYELALESARHGEVATSQEQIEVLQRLGEVRENAGLLEGSLEAYGRALKLAGRDPLLRANLLYARGAAKDRTRAFGGALRDFRTALGLLGGDASAAAAVARARLTAAVAFALYGQQRPSRALAQARLAVASAQEAGEKRSLGMALMLVDLAGLEVEGPGSGRNLEEALSIFRNLGDLRLQAGVEANIGFLCAVAGRWQEATGWFDAAREAFTRIGDVVRSTDPAMNLGEMLVKQGRHAEAEPVLRDAIRILSASHFSEGVNRCEIQLARIFIERRDFAAAESLLRRVETEFSGAGQQLAALEAAAMRAFGLHRAGQAAAALSVLDAARGRAGAEAELLLPLVACERARLLGDLGRFDEAAVEIGAGLASARAHGLPYEEAMLLQVRADHCGRLGAAPAPEDVEAAREILNRLGVRQPQEIVA